MANEANIISDVRLQFQDFFGSLSIGKRVTLLGALLSILLGMVALIIVSNQSSWAPLYSNLDPADAGLIVTKLQENQIPHMLAPGGRTVMVPPQMVDQARLSLASAKVLPGSGVGFMDLFATPTLGETEFQQQVKYRIAQEGELARLITRIASIRSAKVSLAIPKKSLFSNAPQLATASVSLDSVGTISRDQVSTVAHLVASAVDGLAPRGVKITDQTGALLSQGVVDNTMGGKINDNYIYKRRFEQELEQKVITQLEEVVGRNRVRVNVSALMNFNKETISEQLINPDQVSVVSEQLVDENSTGSRSVPVGPAGVTTNLPEATGREAATVSEFVRKNATRNFDSSRRNLVTELASGRVLRLSVSVLLDNKRPQIMDAGGAFIGRDNIPWTEAEKNNITNLVKATIAFDANRGDEVFVGNIPFALAVEEDKAASLEASRVRNQFIVDVVRYVALGIGIVALIMLVIRPMAQKLGAKPADLDLLMGLPATIGELEGEELEIPTERDSGIPPRDKIVEIAKQDPLKTAALVRTWLRDRK